MDKQMRKFDCEVIFDEFGFCQFFEMEGRDEAEALENLYKMEPNYRNFKVNLYDITDLGGIDDEY
jgi:hypothetical protein